MKPIDRLVVGISLAILVVAPISMAQVIEEITVTARKKSENLQDVPISVNVITSQMLDRMGIKDLQDVTKLDPSLVFDKGFAPDDIRVVVRGIDNGRGRPVVATVIDGVDISSEALATAGASQLISPRLIDIERIEIVKGPQIALYGRTAFAGAIQYVTKGASEEPEITASIDVAQDGFHEARFSSSAPVTDKLGIRFNALTWDFDGFHTNTVTGNKVGGGDGRWDIPYCIVWNHCLCRRSVFIIHMINSGSDGQFFRWVPVKQNRRTCAFAAANFVAGYGVCMKAVKIPD